MRSCGTFRILLIDGPTTLDQRCDSLRDFDEGVWKQEKIILLVLLWALDEALVI